MIQVGMGDDERFDGRYVPIRRGNWRRSQNQRQKQRIFWVLMAFD
jgi:hypothetical protein